MAASPYLAPESYLVKSSDMSLEMRGWAEFISRTEGILGLIFDGVLAIGECVHSQDPALFPSSSDFSPLQSRHGDKQNCGISPRFPARVNVECIMGCGDEKSERAYARGPDHLLDLGVLQAVHLNQIF